MAGRAGWRAESLPRSLREQGGTPGAPGRLFLAGGGDGAAGRATEAEVATASSGSARRCPRGPARWGRGRRRESAAGGKGRRARSCGGGCALPGGQALQCSPGFADGLPRSRSGSSSAPAAGTTSGACLHRGTKVDRGRCRRRRAALQGRPELLPGAQRSRVQLPPFRGQLPQVTHRGLQRTAVPWRWSPGVVGVNRGTLRSSSAARGRRRSPAPSSLLAISARFASAAMGRAVRAEALQTRQGLELPEPLREPHFRVSRSLLHIPPLGLPPRPSGAEFGSVSTEAHTHRRASWLCSGTGSGARLAQSIASGDLQDLVASALSADTIPSHGCPRDRRVGSSRPYTRPGWHISLLKWLGGRPRKSLELSAQSRKISLGYSDS